MVRAIVIGSAFLLLVSAAAFADEGRLVTSSALNVRIGPGTGYPLIGVAARGQKYVAVESSGGWYRIWWAGGSGWIYGAYTSSATGAGAQVTVATLDAHTNPSASSAATGSAALGQVYFQVGAFGPWKQVWFGGKTRWFYGPETAIKSLAPAGFSGVGSWPSTLCGFDTPWIVGKYVDDLTTGFDPNDWKHIFGRAQDAKAHVVRVFVLHGLSSWDVVWSSADPHVPVGPVSGFLDHIKTVASIAHDHNLQIYWTLMDGAVTMPGMPALEKERFWNVYNGDYGIGDLWRANVLGPIVDAIYTHPESIYAIDMHNEIDAPVTKKFFRDSWIGARTFMEKTAALVHAHAPGVRVTASSGGTTEGSLWILLGFFDGLGLDHLDIHAYNDAGAIPLGSELAAHARSRGVPIVLGEFGQKSTADSPALQAWVVTAFLTQAKELGFEAALAWELESEAPWFSFYYGDGTPKPALDLFTWFATH